MVENLRIIILIVENYHLSLQRVSDETAAKDTKKAAERQDKNKYHLKVKGL